MKCLEIAHLNVADSGSPLQTIELTEQSPSQSPRVAGLFSHLMTFLAKMKRPLMATAVGLSAVLLTHCEDDQQSCEGLSDEAALRRNEIEQAAENRSCSDDADCVATYHPLRCFRDCGEPVAVSASSEEDVAANVSAVEAELCGQMDQLSCSPSVPVPCGAAVDPALARTVCRSGRCDLEYPPED